MKSFIYKVLGREKGSLTVEAALVLPIFLCAILTIGFLTKLVYTHEIVQHAITEAASEMASSSYLYYVSEISNIDDTISSELEGKKEKSEEHINSIVNCYKELNTSISQIDNSSNNIGENISSINISEAMNSVDQIISQGETFDNNISQIKSVLKDISSNPKDEMISVAALIAKEGYDKGKTAIGNTLIQYYIKKHGLTDTRLNNLNIDKLDFSSSTYFNNNENIDVIVKYNVDIPLPIKFVRNLHIVQRATTRAWMGGDDDYSEAPIDEEQTSIEDEEALDKEKDAIKVYVSESGKSYHRFGCYHIFKEIEALDLNSAIKQNLDPCETCNPPINGNGSYVVYKSKKIDDGKYHREGCNYLFKKIKEMSLEEASKEYMPCKTCKPPKKKN